MSSLSDDSNNPYNSHADQADDYSQWIEAEAWQMGLYGPGGHYLPHYDAFDTLVLLFIMIMFIIVPDLSILNMAFIFIAVIVDQL